MPLFSLAQTQAPVSDEMPIVPEGPSCFDYYKFQSITIDLHTEKQAYKAGEGAMLIGSLTNKNTYPVVGGSLILRISKFGPRSQVGNDITDEWTAKENINLIAGEKMLVSFNYQLPSGLPTGTYTLTSFFLTQDKFNLAGLSFTDDIYGSYATFTVEGKSEKSIKFDRTGVKINSEPYRIFGFLPKFYPADTKSVSMSVPLKNDTAELLNAAVSYEFYVWDGVAKENLLKSWNEKVSIPKNSSKALSFNLELSDRPVYYIKIKAIVGDQKSEIHIRFVKEGFRPRLNYVGIAKFPLEKDDKATLFACYHNTTGSESSGKLNLSLKDQKGKELAQTSYNGKMTGDIEVLTKEISGLNLENLILSAQLFDDKGSKVDEVNIPYDCSKFSQSLCKKPAETRINWPMLGAGAVIVLVALYFLRRHFNNKGEPQV